MSILKWLLNACLILALIFLGLKAEPEQTPADKNQRLAQLAQAFLLN